MEPNNARNHILICNIYAANEKWEEVARATKLLRASEVKRRKVNQGQASHLLWLETESIH